MIEYFSRDTIRFFLEADTGYDLSGNQKKFLSSFFRSLFHLIRICTTMVIAQTEDGRTFDMTRTPYHRSAAKQKGDAIMAVYLHFACH